jgi:hypothetical protein
MKTKRVGVLAVALIMLCAVVTISFVSATATTTSTGTFSPYGNGVCTGISDIRYSRDGVYTKITGSGSGAGGTVVCSLSGVAASGSKVESYVYGSDYSFYIYYKNSSTQNYDQLIATTVNNANPYKTVTTIGSSTSFDTVAIAVYNAGTGSVTGYVDCVITK